MKPVLVWQTRKSGERSKKAAGAEQVIPFPGSRRDQREETFQEATVTEWTVGGQQDAAAPVTIRMVSSGFGAAAPSTAPQARMGMAA
ncbi:hypothetical protein G3578_12375 [Brevibacillus sp. SYP-B805]|uniref:hypothetical protein n=1 Tax=Brevibacillus sp. SYP-B805 TaxID=1578199 RepID=UPI0013EE0B5C|nr:hypothetical protein [Brevibacillus sp. SYP-B805]NGQ95953.1 hypothetical protein [Brevibacillus sp. SYP-B805]